MMDNGTKGGETMTEKRISETLPCGRICYPEFTEDSANPETHGRHKRRQPPSERMNAFYRALRDAAAAYAASLAQEQANGIRTYTADYVCRTEQDGTVVIEYTLRLRRRGRTEAQKTLRHVWRDGTLVPAQKQKETKRGMNIFPPRRKTK